jgi:hypothetical protein
MWGLARTHRQQAIFQFVPMQICGAPAGKKTNKTDVRPYAWHFKVTRQQCLQHDHWGGAVQTSQEISVKSGSEFAAVPKVSALAPSSSSTVATIADYQIIRRNGAG